MADLPIRCDTVSVVVLRKAARWETLLLLRTQPPLSWSQIAGGIEEGERAVDTARRELREETGLAPDALYTADWHEAFYEPERERLSLVPVFVAIVSADATVTLNAEHADYRWLTLAEALETVSFSGQRAMLRHVTAEFVDRQPSALQRLD